MNIEKIRLEFPIFKSNPNLIFLDSAATSQKPQCVVDSVAKFYLHQNSNVHRGLYSEGELATVLYEDAREKVAKFLNAKDSSEIIFTSGTTESINFIASTWGLENIKHGDEILITQAEHHANLLPWQYVANKTGADLKFIEINPKTYRFDNPEKKITSRTKLVCVTYHSNVVGPVWGHGDVQLLNLISIAKKNGIKILVDLAQVMAHQKIDLQILNADFVAFSGHKMFAPTGVGVLYIKQDIQPIIRPFKFGGGMVQSVDWYTAQWASSPHKFEAGTPPIASAIGLGTAIDFIQNHVNQSEIKKYEAILCSTLIEKLKNLAEVKIFGNVDLISERGHLLSFEVDKIHAHDIAGLLGASKISVRAGHHCAQPLVKCLGAESLVRVSFAVYNNLNDVNIFFTELKRAITFLKK